MFDRPGIFYFNYPKIIFNDQWVLDQEKIHLLKKHSLVIADFSSEHYGITGLDDIYQNLEKAGINFILLSHDHTDHKKAPRLLHYPHWYVETLKFNFPISISNKRSYLWSCLNRNPRPHRIYNFLLSQDKSYFPLAIFTMTSDHGLNTVRPDDYPIDQKIMQRWEDIKNNIGSKLVNSMDCSIPAYTDAYIHLVTETTVIPRIFITEKTWKSIAVGQMFLVFGNPGSIAYLRSLGVDVFDDIIDHCYDLEQDWQIRLHKIHAEIERLVSIDLESIYKHTESRRNANMEKFRSKQFIMKYETDIMHAIDTYL